MTETKAPLPQDVENTLKCLELSWPTSGGKLRTHIAELNEQIDCMSRLQAGMDESLVRLEAENKRLREVGTKLKNIAVMRSGTGALFGDSVLDAAIEWEALAHTEGETNVCKQDS